MKLKTWWIGDERVEIHMSKLSRTLDKYNLSTDVKTDIYNRAYEAVYEAIKVEENKNEKAIR